MAVDDAAQDLIGFDTVTLTGDPVRRAIAALRVAQLQVRLTVQDTASWRMEAALSQIEDEIAAHIAQIQSASDDDRADAEATGEAQSARQAWLPLRAA